MEALLENLKSKIDELGNAKQSKDPIKFFNIVKDIQLIISELGQPLGVEVPRLLSVNTNQILTDLSHLEPSNRDQKVLLLFRRIEDLFLSYRATKCLKSQDIVYIGDLVQKSESELLRIRNFGRKCLREVSRELAHIGFRLGTRIRGWRPENLEEWLNLLGQESTQAAETQLEQKHKVSLPTEPVRVSRRDFINLLHEVDEFELSVRTANCLKNLKIIYIGDLVHRKESELLQTRNFGRKSLLEIKKILGEMNLDLGMSILGWPPDNIEKATKFFSSELEQIRMQGVINGQRNLRHKFDYLEDELFHLASLIGHHRYAQIVRKHLGWDGQMPRTLEAVGRDFNITRERVRQICLKFERKVKWKGRNRALHLPILDSALQFVAEHLPTHCSYIESELANRGISRGIVRPEGLLTAAEILDRTAPFSLVTLGRKRFVVKAEAVKEPKLILQLARKSIEHWGVATFIDIAAQVAERTNRPASQNFTKTVLSSSKDFHLLDECGGWFWLSSVPRNRLINVIQKILSVAGQIDISQLRAGIGRHHRMEGFAPPRRVLLEFCRDLPWCRVEGNIVIADPPLNWEEILAGSTEWAIAAILKEHGLVMPRMKLEEMCLDLGMNQHTFQLYLSSTPIITRYAVGVYGLRGAKIHPGIIESLKPEIRPKESLMDFGWTSDGKIWLAIKLSQATISRGVFSVPAAMKQFLEGTFHLQAADGGYIGNLKIKDYRAWSLSEFFKRRGGEPGDYLVLAFDLAGRRARVFVGDKDLLDDFRAEN